MAKKNQKDKSKRIKFQYYDGGYNLLQIAFGESSVYTQIVIPPEDLNLLASMYLGVAGYTPAFMGDFGLKKVWDGFEAMRIFSPQNADVDRKNEHAGLRYTMWHRSEKMAKERAKLNKKELPLELYISTIGNGSEIAGRGWWKNGYRPLESDWRIKMNRTEASEFRYWLLEAAVSNNYMEHLETRKDEVEAWNHVEKVISKMHFLELAKLWRKQWRILRMKKVAI